MIHALCRRYHCCACPHARIQHITANEELARPPRSGPWCRVRRTLEQMGDVSVGTTHWGEDVVLVRVLGLKYEHEPRHSTQRGRQRSDCPVGDGALLVTAVVFRRPWWWCLRGDCKGLWSCRSRRRSLPPPPLPPTQPPPSPPPELHKHNHHDDHLGVGSHQAATLERPQQPACDLCLGRARGGYLYSSAQWTVFTVFVFGMTSLTGKTEMTLQPTRKQVSFPVAMAGVAFQFAVLGLVWSSAGGGNAYSCMWTPWSCLPGMHGYREADPFGRLLAGTLLLASLVWLMSVLQRDPVHGSDCSIVDRLWSILPPAVMWALYAMQASPASPRLLVMCLLSTVWGARLTWNFYIKGGFSGGEDYRWEQVRRWFPGWQFELFNLVFICFFQLLLLLAIATPAVSALRHGQSPWSHIDTVATLACLAFIAGETVADAQMFNFQSQKYRRRSANISAQGTIFEAGFIQHGLWSCSRHPNYFCEVSLWWAFYLFSVGASRAWLNWTVAGTVFLTLLFVPAGASIDVTEMLSSQKYEQYKDYQKRVPRFVPWFPRPPPSTGKKTE